MSDHDDIIKQTLLYFFYHKKIDLLFLSIVNKLFEKNHRHLVVSSIIETSRLTNSAISLLLAPL